FRVQPDDAAAVLAHLSQGPGLGIKGVVAGVPQDQNDRITPQITQKILRELVKHSAKITVSKQIELRVVAQGLKVVRKTHAPEQLGDFHNRVDEHQTAHAGKG